MNTPEWVTEAPCRGKAQSMWYPPMEAKDPNLWYEMGRVVCSTCPVWEECLKAGADERWGMFGGLTPKERKRPSETHGKWTDYRRGCQCATCWLGHADQMLKDPIDPDLLPSQGDPEYDDPSRMLFDIL